MDSGRTIKIIGSKEDMIFVDFGSYEPIGKLRLCCGYVNWVLDTTEFKCNDDDVLNLVNKRIIRKLKLEKINER